MSAAIDLALLFAGLAVLWLAGDRAVGYASRTADFLGISGFMVGFLVMSVSTGLPEITTAVVSSFMEAPQLSAGDITGSSLVNLTLILGLAAVVAGGINLGKYREELLRVLGVTTGLVLLLYLLPSLGVFHGLALLALYLLCVIWLREHDLSKEMVEFDEEGSRRDVAKLMVSLLFLVVGARIVVESAIGISETVGFPLEALGATVIAVGTGLPELSLEINAVKKGRYGIALGDIFGSTLINLTLVLGILSLVSPAGIDLAFFSRIAPYMLAGILVVIFSMSDRVIGRKEGILLLLIFTAYLIQEAAVFL